MPAKREMEAVLERLEKLRTSLDLAGVEIGRIFSSAGLRVAGKTFAFFHRDNGLALKLPAARVSELLERGIGMPFIGGRGAPLREWIIVPDLRRGRTLAAEAHAFVSGATRARGPFAVGVPVDDASVAAAREMFERLAHEHLARPGGGRISMFGRQALTCDGKIFAMLDGDRLAVRLPQTECAALLESGEAQPAVMSPRMRSWVSIAAPADARGRKRWQELANRARKGLAEKKTSNPLKRHREDVVDLKP